MRLIKEAIIIGLMPSKLFASCGKALLPFDISIGNIITLRLANGPLSIK